MSGVRLTIIGALLATGAVTTGSALEPVRGAAAAKTPTCTASSCHLPVIQHERVHKPLVDNRCDACHVPKQGGTPFQAGVRHEFKRAGDNPELCYACHDRLGTDDFVHEPVKMGVCTLCHDPHGSERELLLRVETDRRLCGQCHHVTVDQGGHVHPPVSDGTCGACHSPHGSGHEKFLRAAAPELCLDCHDTIEELLDDAEVVHDPVTTGRSCLNCHDPHASDYERVLTEEPMALCLSCHDKELDSDGGKIRNMARYLETNPNHHGPIRDRNCSACHRPHGGANRRLLTEAYPEGPYAPFDEERYTLCLDCHDVEMVEEEHDDEATEFRNGDLNLHFVHVNREKQGTSCGACHDVHAGAGPKHIVAPMAFGQQTSLTEYRATATGGSCTTQCHATWAYDRIQPAQNE